MPIIVLTGFPDTDMATSFLRSGVVDYLVKPVEGEKLRTAVARAMEQCGSLPSSSDAHADRRRHTLHVGEAYQASPTAEMRVGEARLGPDLTTHHGKRL